MFNLRLILIWIIALMPSLTVLAQTVPRNAGPYLYTATPDKLYLISEDITYPEKIAVQTLMGVIAQTKPEILRDISGHRSFAEKAGVIIDETYYKDIQGLLAHFANRIDGYILCNKQDKSTNVAISLAGVLNAVAVPTEVEQQAISAGLPKLLDVRERDEAWALANYGNLFSKKVASYQQSSDDRGAFMGDYSTYTKAFQFWDTAPTGSLAQSVFNRMEKRAAFFGWGPHEYETVEALSSKGLMIHPSDWATNMSALTNIPATKDTFHHPDPIKPFEVKDNTHTVCFVISDGDNVQWLLGTHGNLHNWNNPNRAKVNLGWTISPALVDLAPSIYEHYIDHALTTNEGRNVLLAGPSGRGYYLPGRFPDDLLEQETAELNRYMKKADLGIVNIIDADDSDMDPVPYLKQPNIDALFYYTYGANYTGRAGQIDWYKDKPSIGGRYTLWGTLSGPEDLANKLNAMSTDIHSSEGYSLIPVHIWSRDVDDVIDCINRLAPHVRVVAPDEFVWLVRKNIKGVPVGQGNGLRGEYYSGYNRDQLQFTRTDSKINYDWAGSSPNVDKMGTDQFSVKWSGEVMPLYSEDYTFIVNGDDGVKLTVNGQVVINDYDTQGAITRRGTPINLQAGEKYEITLEYAEGGGNAYCYLEWESANQMRQVIPKAQLFSRPVKNTTGPITVFENCNYDGYHAGFGIGEYKLDALKLKGVQNDEISSIKVQPGYKVILYQHENFEGESIELTEDNTCLGDWDEYITSFKVVAQGVTNLEGNYNIKNTKSRLYLDVVGGTGGRNENINVQIWTPTAAPNQTFALHHLGNGVYSITANHSNKSLDIQQYNMQEGANIWQRSFRNQDNQKFIAIATTNGTYKFVSVANGKLLDVKDGNTSPETNVVMQADNMQASAEWELIPAPAVETGNGQGLYATYYNGKNFESNIFSRTDATVNFNWGEGSPGSGITNDSYSIRWSGKVEPQYTGLYTFYVDSDNGRKLWVNDQLLIDQWIADWGTEYKGEIYLEAGVQYDIKLEYFEDYGGASCVLKWAHAAQQKQVIPQSQLYSNYRFEQFIQAEDYASMSGIEVESTTDEGGGSNVGYVDDGDWMAYNNITIPTSGNYTIEYRIASEGGGGKLSIDLNAGAIVLGEVAIPATGGWQTWQTVSHTVHIDAGTYNFGIFAQVGGWNINWWRITQQDNAAKVGMNTTPAKEQVIYPNPFSNSLQVKFEGASANITIIDALGNTVKKMTINSDKAIDLDHLKPGLYLIQVESQSGITTERIIKNNK